MTFTKTNVEGSSEIVFDLTLLVVKNGFIDGTVDQLAPKLRRTVSEGDQYHLYETDVLFDPWTPRSPCVSLVGAQNIHRSNDALKTKHKESPLARGPDMHDYTNDSDSNSLPLSTLDSWWQYEDSDFETEEIRNSDNPNIQQIDALSHLLQFSTRKTCSRGILSKPRQKTCTPLQDACPYSGSEKFHLDSRTKLKSKPMSALDAWWQHQAQTKKEQNVRHVTDQSNKVQLRTMHSSSSRPAQFEKSKTSSELRSERCKPPERVQLETSLRPCTGFKCPKVPSVSCDEMHSPHEPSTILCTRTQDVWSHAIARSAKTSDLVKLLLPKKVRRKSYLEALTNSMATPKDRRKERSMY